MRALPLPTHFLLSKPPRVSRVYLKLLRGGLLSLGLRLPPQNHRAQEVMTAQEFDEIYNEYWKYVYWLCRRLLNNEEAALDAAQDVFCRKWKAIHTYNPAQGGFKNWLTHNAYHQCVDVIRQRARHNEELWEEEEIELLSGTPLSGQQRQATPSQLEWRVVLCEAMEALSPQERLVLMLRFVAGSTRGEVESLMGLSPSKVRTLEDKGLRRLRDWMQAHGIDAVDDRLE